MLVLPRRGSWLTLFALLGTSSCGLEEFPQDPSEPASGSGANGSGAGADPGDVEPDSNGGMANPDTPSSSNPNAPENPGNPGEPAADPEDPNSEPPAVDPEPDPSEPFVGVEIDGKRISKDRAIVFIHIGHSNMAGRTDTPRALRPLYFETHPQLWTFRQSEWNPAKEPLSGDLYTRGRAGPGMAILRTALDLKPDGYMVSIGRGQDGSRGGECKAFRRNGLMYDVVMDPAKALKGKVKFGGIFSMLVLMAIFDKPNLERFHECLEGVAQDMREDLGDPDIPFIMSDWEMGATGQFDPTRSDAVVAREQLMVAQQNIARSIIVPTDELPMSDDHHFDLEGYKIWAERAFDGMIKSDLATWVIPKP